MLLRLLSPFVIKGIMLLFLSQPFCSQGNLCSILFLSSVIQERLKMEGDIVVSGIAVFDFSCGISVILILNCGIAVSPRENFSIASMFTLANTKSLRNIKILL